MPRGETNRVEVFRIANDLVISNNFVMAVGILDKDVT